MHIVADDREFSRRAIALTIGVAAYRNEDELTFGKLFILPFRKQRAWQLPDGKFPIVRHNMHPTHAREECLFPLQSRAMCHPRVSPLAEIALPRLQPSARETSCV